jgi:hypothetical protein
MGLKAKFTKADIAKMMKIKLANLEQLIINRLIFIGETFVRNARLNGNYGDVTGNLRSSIGYIILKNGVKIKENFEKSEKGSDKQTGVNKAKSLINELKADFLEGYTLIVVAGMDYAATVESRGKDVLTASSIIAKNDLKKAIKSIKQKLKN